MSESPSLPHLSGWDADWAGLRVVVTGLGVTGFSAADTLAELGAEVIVLDGATSEKKRMDAETLKIVGVKDVRFGTEHLEQLPTFDAGPCQLVVTSPGWRPDAPLMRDAASRGVPVWSDIQLAWRLGARPGAKTPQWLVLTGTNGKTTTVTLLEAMLQADGRRAVACGNIGLPVLDAIRDPEGYDALAVELSSFQLHWTEAHGAEASGAQRSAETEQGRSLDLSPTASAVLNIAHDHVDWHGDFGGYWADKAKIFHSTRVACIYNAADPETEKMVREADVVEGCRAVSFTTDTPAVSQIGLVRSDDGDDLLVDRAFLDDRRHQALELGLRSDLGPVAPKHLVANALAAAALARAAGVEPEAIRQALRDHTPGDHRIQPVAKAADVLWINDSKATNPHAAEASLSSFSDIVWIAGGLPKGVDYDPLIQQIASRLRYVILIGTDSSQLRSSLERHAPQVPVLGGGAGEDETQAQLRSTDGAAAMRAAVSAANRSAEPGHTVLLAPAAASMDQFRSYAERGQAFIDAVAALMENQT
ncbi:UDP-N-acetylmuramoyl-L-alanine--D-glutamate ligase [Nesterenkonia flava]|uniref:UDP-N-acetylmuramoylalanine--D-glutamate ligase n=1 Tax=Nesterenkonia flava TaxID=469799 RepID=A0ABU1FV55_9MICC|nr:UDP-N-acetylmuramoyl-L-alanine--D-glutamate ligase [Nesterenkonia flava]MDR5712539.1 UDP-N-acetylmuramoyl-L-alanine--D-glutamate ligase [Nesterenkonia flava]